MLLAHNNQDATGVRKHTAPRSISVGRISMRFIMVGLFAAIVLLYLAQSTQSAARSYEVRALEEKRKALTTEAERLELEVVRLRSLQEIQKAIEPSPEPTSSEKPTEGEKPDETASWEPVGTISHIVPVDSLAERP